MTQSEAWRNADVSDTGRDVVEVKEEEVESGEQARRRAAIKARRSSGRTQAKQARAKMVAVC